MLNQIFATKLAMSQAWTNEGKRLPITKCKVEPNQVIAVRSTQAKAQDNELGRAIMTPCQVVEVGYGDKKLKRMPKPVRTQLTKAGFDHGVKQIRGLKNTADDTSLTAGSILNLTDLLQVGDVVEVQGTSKGKGFAGVMKRHNFHGGPATHGQSDRARAPGSIGQTTHPGRVHKGHKMAGHMGSEAVTVSGLVVVYIDPQTQEVWLSGPIPGANQGIVRLSKTGEKRAIELDRQASGLPEPVTEVVKEEVATEAAPTEEAVAAPVVEETAATAEETQTEAAAETSSPDPETTSEPEAEAEKEEK